MTNLFFSKVFLLVVSCFIMGCSNTPLVYDATITGKEILTPSPKDTPEINGASVFGVRPGKPLYYRIAASGVRPLVYSAEGLPQGVAVDTESGWITGRAPVDAGDYVVTLRAENSKGKSNGVNVLWRRVSRM